MILDSYRRTSQHCQQPCREGKVFSQYVCISEKARCSIHVIMMINTLILLLTLKHVKQHLLTLNIFKLAHLFMPVLRKFWKTAEILEYQQKANAMSIFRKGRLTWGIDLVNYRPVSLILILKKIMELLAQGLIKKELKGLNIINVN